MGFGFRSLFAARPPRRMDHPGSRVRSIHHQVPPRDRRSGVGSAPGLALRTTGHRKDGTDGRGAPAPHRRLRSAAACAGTGRARHPGLPGVDSRFLHAVRPDVRRRRGRPGGRAPRGRREHVPAPKLHHRNGHAGPAGQPQRARGAPAAAARVRIQAPRPDPGHRHPHFCGLHGLELRRSDEPGCGPSHQSEANCLPYALRWRQDLIDRLADAHATRR